MPPTMSVTTAHNRLERLMQAADTQPEVRLPPWTVIVRIPRKSAESLASAETNNLENDTTDIMIRQ